MFEFIEKHKLGVLLMMMFMQCVSLALDTHSLYDRYEIKRGARMNRTMLDTRARFQIIVIERNWDRFSPDERQFIRAHWDAAEYNSALPLE